MRQRDREREEERKRQDTLRYSPPHKLLAFWLGHLNPGFLNLGSIDIFHQLTDNCSLKDV
jgi:hypothetical protein